MEAFASKLAGATEPAKVGKETFLVSKNYRDRPAGFDYVCKGSFGVVL